ncbi:PAS domain-containing sensor histidine kinase [Rhodonellum sp.]|uniref:PAS domain-containing sensor histidine kinase n=1 Tax=Rhodonellum sp. TaxID=2231180 RepID=UPI0027232BD2|nr:PAS domain-containing sensor histidine kinase [Rhodonellum sp.]MDO9554931.1 PAS domain-containing sensor histidine kinase [Rhodonellum sp.]
MSNKNHLRKKAESIFKERASNINSNLTELDLLSLIHELEIHQIELEIQNKELKLAGNHSENLYRLFSENMEDLITLHDLNLKTIFASPSLEKITGLKMDEFIVTNFLEFLPSNPKEKTGFTKQHLFIVPLKHGITGKEIKLEILWKPLAHKKGEPQVFLLTSRDVTERELVLEELNRRLEKEIELNDLKTKFISMTSHELRTPLATIQSSADLMEIISDGMIEEKTSERLLKQIRKIHIQLSRLTTTLSDVMIFEKSNEDKVGNHQIEVDIRSLFIQLAFNHFGMTGNESKIQLDLGMEPVLLKSDPTLLFHVFRNLIENALKYTPEGSPKPILKLTRKEQSIEVQVIDFGIGIPQKEVRFIFDTFFRASNVRNIKGSGLGLSIVNDLVKKLGGKITISSTENKGSAFLILIPYERNNIIF